jgi:hypothetical protein
MLAETAKYSPFAVPEEFHPFGKMTGIHLTQSMNQVAYLMSYGLAEHYLARARAASPQNFPPPAQLAMEEVLDRRFSPHVARAHAAVSAGEKLPPHPLSLDSQRVAQALFRGCQEREKQR